MTFAGLLALGCSAARVARYTAQSDLSTVAPGTLAANTLGSLLMGFATIPSRTTGAASRSQVTRRNAISRWVDDIFDVLGGDSDTPGARTVWMDPCYRPRASSRLDPDDAGRYGVMRVVLT